MLRVVQTAPWERVPPHMSGYPRLPAPPPQYQRLYRKDLQWPSYQPQPRPRGPPLPPPHGEPTRGHLPPLPYGAPPQGHPPSLPYGAPPQGPPPSLPYGAPPGATGEPPELHPKALLGPFTDVAERKKLCGRLRNPPDRTSSVAAFNAWFVRRRESHVCGAPVSSAQCSATWLPPLCFHSNRRRWARRGTIPRASKKKDLAPLGWRRSRSLCCVFSTCASLLPPEAGVLCVARSARSTCLASAVPLEDRRHVIRVLQKPPPETEGEEAKEGPKEPEEGAPEAAAARAEVSAGGDGCLAGEQVHVAGHCRLRVMPVWFCCASGIRLGVCCAFCVCYALHVSHFRPSSGGQHPVFCVVQAPVRVKEEPPDSPERHAETKGDPDTETAAEGKMTDGEIQEV